MLPLENHCSGDALIAHDNSPFPSFLQMHIHDLLYIRCVHQLQPFSCMLSRYVKNGISDSTLLTWRRAWPCCLYALESTLRFIKNTIGDRKENFVQARKCKGARCGRSHVAKSESGPGGWLPNDESCWAIIPIILLSCQSHFVQHTFREIFMDVWVVLSKRLLRWDTRSINLVMRVSWGADYLFHLFSYWKVCKVGLQIFWLMQAWWEGVGPHTVKFIRILHVYS